MTRGEYVLIQAARSELAATLAVYGPGDLIRGNISMEMDYRGLREGAQKALTIIQSAIQYESLRSTDAEFAAEKAKALASMEPPAAKPDRVPAVEAFDHGVPR